MSNSISRRQFIRVATITTAALAGGFRAGHLLAQATQPAGEKPLYCFPLLGDIHYDKMTHHDMEWVKRDKGEGDVKQIEGYVKVTEQYTPRLLAEMSRIVKEMQSPFVIQVGDLVEGLCGNYDLQALQFNDCFAAIEAANIGAPMLITKGNHDITGPGAPEAFDKVLLPWLSKSAGQELKSANYVFKHQEDVFVFFDAYKPDLDWLDKTLAETKARHLFFIIHPPVVPYNARANWVVFGNENQAEQRKRLLSLLGKSRAIVLSGHLHKFSLLNRETEAGLFVQLAVSSVIRNEVEKPKGELEGVQKFNGELAELEPRFSPNTLERRRQIILEEAAAIKRFEYADAQGYGLVKVYADRVETDVYMGLSKDTWKARELAKRAEPAPA